jgi:hypothetical protein
MVALMHSLINNTRGINLLKDTPVYIEVNEAKI